MNRLNKRGDRRGIYVKSAEHRRKISLAKTGKKLKPLSKERCVEISLARKNWWAGLTKEQRKKQGLSRLGKKHSLKSKRKMAATHIARGSVGHYATLFAKEVKKILGESWRLEYSIPMLCGGKGKFWFLDVANPVLKINIECDGRHHRKTAQKDLDRLRDKELRSMGWKVYRIEEGRIDSALPQIKILELPQK